jgi:MSHA biogenesis protein MshP
MNILYKLKKRTGFALIQAIFVLVVLSLLGVAMVRLISVQSTTSVMAVQGARAYHAARSGLEWGAARAANSESCDGSFELDQFLVRVSCSSQEFTEGTIGPYDVYQVKAVATYGTVGSVDYISRTAEMKVGFP